LSLRERRLGVRGVSAEGKWFPLSRQIGHGFGMRVVCAGCGWLEEAGMEE